MRARHCMEAVALVERTIVLSAVEPKCREKENRPEKFQPREV